jgi:hypothetical protein
VRTKDLTVEWQVRRRTLALSPCVLRNASAIVLSDSALPRLTPRAAAGDLRVDGGVRGRAAAGPRAVGEEGLRGIDTALLMRSVSATLHQRAQHAHARARAHTSTQILHVQGLLLDGPSVYM